MVDYIFTDISKSRSSPFLPSSQMNSCRPTFPWIFIPSSQNSCRPHYIPVDSEVRICPRLRRINGELRIPSFFFEIGHEWGHAVLLGLTAGTPLYPKVVESFENTKEKQNRSLLLKNPYFWRDETEFFAELVSRVLLVRRTK